jgi:hypothetical protein
LCGRIKIKTKKIIIVCEISNFKEFGEEFGGLSKTGKVCSAGKKSFAIITHLR